MTDLHPELMAGIAIATARIILGVLFLFQGMDKIFHLKRSELSSVVPKEISDRIPGSTSLFLIKGGAWLEMIGGILLVMGLLIQPALIILAIDLVAVTIAFSFAMPVWDLKHVFPRLVILVFLMLTPARADIFSADHLFRAA